MTDQSKRWNIQSFNYEIVDQLVEQLSIEPIVAKLLILRNLSHLDKTQLQRFLSPHSDDVTKFDQISAPDQLKKASQRIRQAIAKQNLIFINGDPDADGITGTTILVAGLRFLGARVIYDFPVRAREGHGLQPRIVEQAKQQECTLMMTIDCGTRDVEAVQYANTLGIDVIICDHHILGHQLPAALAMINPYMIEEKTSEHDLCGSLLAFKMIIMLAADLQIEIPSPFQDYLIALASLGALSDRVSLLEPMNRIMIKKGIAALNTSKMEGLKALKKSCTASDAPINANEASRLIVPRLNAPGRIGDPDEEIPDSNIVVDLLLIGSGKKSAKKAHSIIRILRNVALKNKNDESKEEDTQDLRDQIHLIESVNERRKRITSQIEDEIETRLDSALQQNERIIMIRGENWNSGVIGIDADRIRERFLKPVIIFTTQHNSDYLRASVRSIPTVNMYELLSKISDEFEEKYNKKLFCIDVPTKVGKEIVYSFGGHPQACGFSIHNDNYQFLIDKICLTVNEMDAEYFQFSYDIIDTITFSDIKPSFAKIFEKAAPFGQKFDIPIFLIRGCRFGKSRAFGSRHHANQTPHIEIALLPSYSEDAKDQRQLKAVGYGLYKKYREIVKLPELQKFDVILTLESYKGAERKKGKGHHDHILINILDFRKSKG